MRILTGDVSIKTEIKESDPYRGTGTGPVLYTLIIKCVGNHRDMKTISERINRLVK